MKIQVLIVSPNGLYSFTEIDKSLGNFQGIVGGYIEPVRGNDWMAYVNEDGIAEQLDYNDIATILAGQRLLGTVIFMGPDETDVPADLIERLNKHE